MTDFIAPAIFIARQMVERNITAEQLAEHRNQNATGGHHDLLEPAAQAPRGTAEPSTDQFEVRDQTLRVWH